MGASQAFLSSIMASINQAKFSPEELRDFLWHDNIETRKGFVKLFTSSELWLPKHNLSLPEERDLAFKRLKAISDAKLFSVKDFATNPRNVFTGACRSGVARCLVVGEKQETQHWCSSISTSLVVTTQSHKLYNVIRKLYNLICLAEEQLAFS